MARPRPPSVATLASAAARLAAMGLVSLEGGRGPVRQALVAPRGAPGAGVGAGSHASGGAGLALDAVRTALEGVAGAAWLRARLLAARG